MLARPMPCVLPMSSREIDTGSRRTFPFDPNASKRPTTLMACEAEQLPWSATARAESATEARRFSRRPAPGCAGLGRSDAARVSRAQRFASAGDVQVLRDKSGEAHACAGSMPFERATRICLYPQSRARTRAQV